MMGLSKICFLRKFESNILSAFCVTRVLNLEFLQQMYGSLMILPRAVLSIFESQYCREVSLKSYFRF